MNQPFFRPEDFPLPVNFSATRLRVRPTTVEGEATEMEPRLCNCDPGLSASGGDFAFDDQRRAPPRD